MAYTYSYPHPAIATDIAVFTLIAERLHVALIKRGEEPFGGHWALPGGFLKPGEDLDRCAERELHEEVGLEGHYLEHFANFSAPDRDPRERVVSVAYMALIPSTNAELRADTDAAEARWYAMNDLPRLAFDHDVILDRALEALRRRVRATEEIVFALLPTEFTLTQVQAVCEVILGENLDKRNFRRKLLQEGRVVETGGMARGHHRPAKLYRGLPAK